MRDRTSDKRKAALAALDNHARRYKVTIPDRIRAFYTGDFDRYDLHYVNAKVSGWGSSTFQLALTPPTWLNKGDDAINGPRGEWEDARHHLPLFTTDQGLYVVVNLRDPGCPTGWYSEEENSSDGPTPAAKSLDAFLATLTKTAAGVDPSQVSRPADSAQDMDWQEAFSDDGPRAFDVAGGDDD